MASELLSLHSTIVAYDDSSPSSNPSRKVDWRRSISGISVNNVRKEKHTIDPGSSKTIFTGNRTTGINSATSFTVSLKNTGTYRFSWAGGGANPAFRTDRALTPDTHTLTWVINANYTVTVTSSNAGDFTAVQVGDTVFVPGTTTGDVAGPFNVLNEGYWIVLSVNGTGSAVTIKRADGENFSGYSESQVVTGNAQFQAFSASGVQVGDSVDVSAGFNSSFYDIYTVTAVGPTWFQFDTTKPLPVADSGVPNVTGMVFYTDARRYLKVEADQECTVRVNGDTSDYQRLVPWMVNDETQVAEYVKTGPTWSLVVVNKAQVQLEITVISAG